MNYGIHYEKLINRARNRIIDTFTETHHIIPRCMGGSDDQLNLVELTPEEHYLAHQLLVKMHPATPKLIYAAQLMCFDKNGKRTNNKLYGWIKRRLAKEVSKRFLGKVTDHTYWSYVHIVVKKVVEIT